MVNFNLLTDYLIMTTKWTRDDLRIYLLIYCANADFVETPQELDFIKSKFGNEGFIKMHSEFEKDNDYQSIQKIQAAYQNLSYDSPDELIEEVREFFNSDGDFDVLERNLIMGLKHILN